MNHLRKLSLYCLVLPFVIHNTEPAFAGDRYAVLAGVNEYQHRSLETLQFAVADVTDLSSLLEKSGYAVTLLTKDMGKNNPNLLPTKSNIFSHIKSVLRKAKKDDTVILAFTGHGLQFTGQKDAFFCPSDGRPFADEVDSLISIAEVYKELDKSFAGVKIVFMDACRNDPDPGRGRGGVNAGIALRPPKGVGTLFSCSAGQRAFEHDQLGHGVFFHYVLEGLRGAAKDTDGEITFDTLSSYVRKNVPRRVRTLFPNRIQSPNLRADLEGVPPILISNSNSFANSINMQFARIEGGTMDNYGVKKIIKTVLLSKTEVTRNQFQKFLDATNYKTMAELRTTDDLSAVLKDINESFNQKFSLPEFRKAVADRIFEGKFYDLKSNKFIKSSKPHDLNNVGWNQTGEHPVVNISIADAVMFCKWLSKKESKTYRLPTFEEYGWFTFRELHDVTNRQRPDMIKLAQIEEKKWLFHLAEWQFKNPNFDRFDMKHKGFPTTQVGLLKPDKNGVFDLLSNIEEYHLDVHTQNGEKFYSTCVFGKQGYCLPVTIDQYAADFVGFRVVLETK